MSFSFDDFVDSLNEMEGRLTKNVRNALHKNALRAMRAAKINATSFPRVVTGRLRNSITGTTIVKDGLLTAILRAGGHSIAGNDPRLNPPAEVVYAAVQEFGGGPFNIRPKRYMQRARDKVLPRFNADIDKATRLALEGKNFG